MRRLTYKASFLSSVSLSRVAIRVKIFAQYRYRLEEINFGKMEPTSFHADRSGWHFIEFLQPGRSGVVIYGYGFA